LNISATTALNGIGAVTKLAIEEKTHIYFAMGKLFGSLLKIRKSLACRMIGRQNTGQFYDRLPAVVFSASCNQSHVNNQ